MANFLDWALPNMGQEIGTYRFGQAPTGQWAYPDIGGYGALAASRWLPSSSQPPVSAGAPGTGMPGGWSGLGGGLTAPWQSTADEYLRQISQAQAPQQAASAPRGDPFSIIARSILSLPGGLPGLNRRNPGDYLK